MAGCMGCGSGKAAAKTTNTGYTPKSRTAVKSNYTPNGVPNAFGATNTGFGKPAVKMSFGSKR